jgi:hypothetical protein
VRVTVSPSISNALSKLQNIKEVLLDDVINPVSSIAYTVMGDTILNDETRAGGKIIDNQAFADWFNQALPGRRTDTATMINTLDIIDTPNGTLIGWENPEEYYEAQNEGWNTASQAPEGAALDKVAPAHFVENALDIIDDILPDKLQDVVNGLGV